MAGQTQQALEALFIVLAVDHGTHGNGTHVDHGIDMLLFQILIGDIDGIEGLTGGFNADGLADLIHAVVHQGQQQKDGLDDRLDGEGLFIVTGLEGLAVVQHDIHAEIVDIALGQLGNVAGGFAHCFIGGTLFDDLFQKCFHSGVNLSIYRIGFTDARGAAAR